MYSVFVTACVVIYSCHVVAAIDVSDLCAALQKHKSDDYQTQQLYDKIDCSILLSECGKVRTIDPSCPHPWVVSIRRTASKEHICVGTLLNQGHVLTAAHCVTSTRAASYYGLQVGLGSGKLSHLQYVDVETVHVHSMFDRNSMAANDLAILTLQKKVSLTSCISPICLPGHHNNIEEERSVTVVGWGLSNRYPPSQGQRPGNIQITKLPVLSRRQCLRRNPLVAATRHVICVGNPSRRTGSCIYDKYAGAPMMTEHDGKWFLHGVVSDEGYCKDPSIGMNVADFVSWISKFK